MSDHEASHLPVTTRVPHALGICPGCSSGTCRPVAGVYVLFVELSSDVALTLALERPELRLRESYHTIYHANPHIVGLVTQVMVEESGKRNMAHDHAREARLQRDSGNNVASEEAQTTAEASQKVEPSKHIRDLTSPIAVAANAAIKEALITASTSGFSSQSSPEQGRIAVLSLPPQPLYATSAPVKTKRVRRTVPKRLARRPAPHISISHPSVLHVPENIATHAIPVDKSNLREENVYGTSSLMANNCLPPNPSTLSHGFASLPPFLWPVPYAHQTPPMSRSSCYQSSHEILLPSAAPYYTPGDIVQRFNDSRNEKRPSHPESFPVPAQEQAHYTPSESRTCAMPSGSAYGPWQASSYHASAAHPEERSPTFAQCGHVASSHTDNYRAAPAGTFLGQLTQPGPPYLGGCESGYKLDVSVLDPSSTFNLVLSSLSTDDMELICGPNFPCSGPHRSGQISHDGYPGQGVKGLVGSSVSEAGDQGDASWDGYDV